MTPIEKVEAIYGLLGCEMPNILNDQSASVIIEELTGTIEDFRYMSNKEWYGWQEEFPDDNSRYGE